MPEAPSNNDPTTAAPPEWTALLAAPVGPESDAFFEDYPPAWHEGPSEATLILEPLGVSATKFVRANERLRSEMLDHLVNKNARKLLGQTFVCGSVALACLVALSGPIRAFALGGCALKAGSDLARYLGRKKTIDAAWGLTEDDLELVKPVDAES